MIKGSVNSNGKLAGYGFHFYPLPHPQVLLDGAPLKKTLTEMIARRRGQRRGNPENSGIINESMGVTSMT